VLKRLSLVNQRRFCWCQYWHIHRKASLVYFRFSKRYSSWNTVENCPWSMAAKNQKCASTKCWQKHLSKHLKLLNTLFLDRI